MRRTEKLGWLDGVYLATNETKIFFDPVKNTIDDDAHILISHAHADHTRGFNSSNIKYSTIETKRIYESLRRKEVKGCNTIGIGETIELGNVKVKALNAGHILGSAQFLIETPEKVILYTGDINCINTITTDAAEHVDCDTLIIEGTYGNPMYRFPPRELVYNEIVRWALTNIKNGVTPILHVYATGKAQEITRLFNDYTTLPVVVDDRVSSVNQVYSDYNNELRYTDKMVDPDEFKASVHVAAKSRHFDSGLKFSIGHATGWALNERGRHGNFPLSNHADFYQLLKFIEASSAKEVYVFTGFIKSFSAYLKNKMKIDAKPLPTISQRRLLDFR